ncbi:MAG: terpene cyclase/mutase family protein [Akkermansiaceae bacterium]|nr:terpene cyclase/mutase family protein [Akkermansiaceae bacterium]
MRFLSLFLALIIIPAGNAQDAPDALFAKWKEKVDPSIERGLQFLAGIQQDDGSFPENYGTSCGIPALVGMAFLSRGHLATEGPYAEALNKSIDYILKHQNRDGLYTAGHAGSGPMYAHNIATLFLSEASGMVDPERQKKIGESLPKAVALILRAQAVDKSDRHKGGWRYHPNSKDSDTSCSGWALMALRSAKLNGAPVPDQAIESALKYLYGNYSEKGGHFGYSDPNNHKLSLTGMGLLCLELCGEHGKPATIKSADYILQNFRGLEGRQFEFYGNYYNAQAMFQIGGKHWETFANWMYETYLSKQKEDGSWYSKEAGRIYGTAMMTLAFTVPYRQLPIYQRDETVDEE